jgi:hypothetical protein
LISSVIRLLLFLLKAGNRRHKSDKHLDEVRAPETFHREPTLRPEHLVRDLDQLRMDIEPVEPAILTVPMPWLVDHVQPMPAVFHEDMLDRKIFPTETTEEFFRYLGEFSVLVGP